MNEGLVYFIQSNKIWSVLSFTPAVACRDPVMAARICPEPLYSPLFQSNQDLFFCYHSRNAVDDQ